MLVEYVQHLPDYECTSVPNDSVVVNGSVDSLCVVDDVKVNDYATNLENGVEVSLAVTYAEDLPASEITSHLHRNHGCSRLRHLETFSGVIRIWKQALITPVHKKGPTSVFTNYRPISIVCLVNC